MERAAQLALTLVLMSTLVLTGAAVRCGLEPYCVCYSLEKVTCEGLPPPADPAAALLSHREAAVVRDLSLQHGLLPELGERALRGLRLDALAVRGCGLHALHRRALAQQPQLRFLLLAGNSLRALHRDAFAGAPRLAHLDLHDNLLSDTAALRNLSAVKVLNLRSNVLQALGPGAFCCGHLRSLDVSDNEISSVDSNTFENATNLEELDMSENDIASLPADLFANTTHLFELKLSRNKISLLDFLRDIPSLRFLQLSNNALQSLPGGVFWGVPGLYHISLARNHLTDAWAASFQGLEALVDLDLSQNALTWLGAGAFVGAPLLQRLNVEGNRLTQLRFLRPPGARALTYLLAADNAVTALDPCDRTSQEDEEDPSADGAPLQELDLSRNPLRRVCAEALASWPALALLRMRDTALDDESARAVAAASPPHLLHVDLGGNALSDVPVRNAVQMRYIALSANSITVLPEGAFRNVSHEYLVLDLAENGMESIHPLAFTGLEEVATLNISCNDIQFLDDGVFQKITNIWDLDLSHNSITELNFLRNISSLRQLNISHNNIKKIPHETFYALSIPLLFYLDLSVNNISTVENFAFKGLRNLWDLNMSNNFISSLQKDTFVDTTSLWDLNLSQNNISDMEWLCISSLRHLNLSGNALAELPEAIFSTQNTTLLATLDLSRNALRSLGPRALVGLSHLEHLDLSQNALKNVPATELASTPALVDLDLSGNQLHDAPELPLLQALRTYDLSGNALNSLQLAATAGAPGLRVLRAARNRLAALDAFTWDVHLPSLREVDLSGNEIASVSTDAFTGCPGLRRVNLSGNRLAQPPALNLPVLRRLSLAANELRTLSDDSFSLVNIPALVVLDLSNNTLSELAANALRPLRQLRTLDLSHNELEELSEDTFTGNTVLSDLNVSDNRLTQIDMVRGLLELRVLNASGNALQTLGPAAARRGRGGRGLPRLELLDVSRNALQQLRARELASMPRLRELDASCNRLQRVPAAVLADARHLAELRVHGNPLSRDALISLTRAQETLSARSASAPKRSTPASVELEYWNN